MSVFGGAGQLFTSRVQHLQDLYEKRKINKTSASCAKIYISLLLSQWIHTMILLILRYVISKFVLDKISGNNSPVQNRNSLE